jgi:hypothetical protein
MNISISGWLSYNPLAKVGRAMTGGWGDDQTPERPATTINQGEAGSPWPDGPDAQGRRSTAGRQDGYH